MNLFFDLDGTLLDSRQRLYQLFQSLVIESNLSFSEYWELKRNKVNHKAILSEKYNYSDEKYFDFEARWMKEIELKKWLDLDIPFARVTDALKILKADHTLYVVTARQSKENATAQINNLGWKSLFKDILVTEQTKTKQELIRSTVITDSSDWIIGDTGNDILTGKKLGIQTIAVLSGFLNKEKLLQYNPDLIINDITTIDNKIL